jgi:disulfide bond formation protein DsbB
MTDCKTDGRGALALLLGALGFQYLAHLPPCEMCHWQRWPYIAAPSSADRHICLEMGQRLVLADNSRYRGWADRYRTDAECLFVALAAIALIVGLLLDQARDGCRHDDLLVARSGLIGAIRPACSGHFCPARRLHRAHPYVMGSGAPEPEISCNAVTWSLFGLSLATYNAIFAFLIAGTGLTLLRRNHAA